MSKLVFYSSVTASFWPISGIISTFFIAKLGSPETVTMGLISKIQPFLMLPIWAITSVVTVLLASAVNTKKSHAIKSIFKKSFLLITIWQSFFSIPFLTLPEILGKILLGSNHEPLPFVYLFFLCIPITVFGRGMAYIAISGLISVGYEKYALLIDVIYVIVLHTLCYYLGYYFGNFFLTIYNLTAFNLFGAALAWLIVKWISARMKREVNTSLPHQN